MVKNLTCKAGDIGTIPGRGNKIPYTMWQVSPSSQLLSLHHSERIHVPQQKIPHETMTISSATTKTLLSQIDLKKKNSVEDSHICQYGYQDNLDHSPTGNNKKYWLY